MSDETERQLINGVPRDQYGTWCPHGKHVLVVDPDDASDYPGTILADPWPCDNCTPEQLDAELAAEVEAYEQDRWNEYCDIVREGLWGRYGVDR